MAELPFMPVRTASLLADTTWMSPEEFGAYCRILFTMWANGGRLMDDERDLARITGMGVKRWRKIGPRIMRLLCTGGGQLSQKRLTDTWLSVQERRVKRIRAALTGHGHSINTNGLDRVHAQPTQGNQNQNQKSLFSYLSESPKKEESNTADESGRSVASALPSGALPPSPSNEQTETKKPSEKKPAPSPELEAIMRKKLNGNGAHQ